MSQPQTPPHLAAASAAPPSTAIFLVLRRMRAPLIVLICTYAIGVFGLTLVPGQDPEGRPWKMDPFEAFYFMSYTASTIGYGEIPHPFSTAQRTWVTVSIYLSVVAWAYAIGTVFSLLQDRGFRGALAAQRFVRTVHHLREPFVLIVGFGQAGERLAESLDSMDIRFVVLDLDQERIDALDLGSFHSDVPGHTGDARNPEELVRAGLTRPSCQGVVALTNDDEANLAVVMTASLLTPGLPVVARTMEAAIADRMQDFGEPMIVDPFNLFGDELMQAVRAPTTYRLLQWLTSDPDSPLPPAPALPRKGRWVIAGYGRFGRHLAQDLQTEGLPVTVIDPSVDTAESNDAITGSATDDTVLDRADLHSAQAFAAATDNDVTNLSLVVAARRRNPDLFVVARQNLPVNAPLFEALAIDSVLVPTHLIAHDALARIGSPMLWQFLQQSRQMPETWSVELLDRLTARCGTRRPEIWRLTLDASDAPSLRKWLARSDAQLGPLLRDPEDREQPLDVVALMLRRGAQTHLAPADDTDVEEGDQLLLAGTPSARRALNTILAVPSALSYVLTGDRAGNSWVWRTLTRHE